jgi:GDP/UDP-N,N'-diacetylbacillosamine 2-epimerase (hydrolysing)
VITGSRAEFGLLEPVLAAFKKRRLDTRLIATGMHLLSGFGRTIKHIEAAGWQVHATVRVQSGPSGRNSRNGHGGAGGDSLAVGRGIQGIGRVLDELDCGVVLLLGDRIETFAAACAAVFSRRVLAHIHGGDRGPGDLDETLRDAISRLAHVHLVASNDAAARLRSMGEEPWRILRVGAPGLDGIRRFRQRERQDAAAGRQRLRELLGSGGPPGGRPPDEPFAVVVQHPCGRTPEREATVMRHIVRAVESVGLRGVIIYPNCDAGHEGIVREIQTLAAGRNRTRSEARWRIFPSLPREDYLRLVSGAAVLIGNSSSGIIESATLGTNAVNVGPRQDDRLRCGPNVIDTDESPAHILQALRRALKLPRPRPSRSCYGDGKAGERIAAILARLRITARLLRKRSTR